jgi:DNA-3-methyladenine glycosylase I
MAPNHPVHGAYHNTEYGFPVTDERALFERLSLEIMQAGLSWEIVLKKREALNRAFDGFDPGKIAGYGEAELQRLLADDTIIRNRLKLQALIANAKIVVEMRATHGGFAGWLSAHHPRSKEAWIRLFKKTFKFTGGEITSEFLMSIGYLPGAHEPECETYAKVLALKPAWKG